MSKQAFEWDAQKGKQNYAKHGITFEIACGAFKDPFAIELLDERKHYDEDRYILIGMAGVTLLFVAYTLRGEAIRIISARGAQAFEHRWYHEEQH